MEAAAERIGQIDNREPIVIREGAHHWPASQKWTPEYLRSILGNCRVTPIASRTGVIRFNPDESHEDSINQSYLPESKFSEIASAIIENRQNIKYYIQQVDIRRQFPCLVPDLAFSTMMPYDVVNLWFGSAGVCTQLHFDIGPNMFVQIYGRKRFLLYPPSMTEYLYKYPDNCRMPHLSYLDLKNLDLSRFPRAGKAFPWRIVLEAGDLLSIPARWWHFVTSETISISVNRWSRISSQEEPAA